MGAATEMLPPGDSTWRRVGRRMLELERAEWGARAFSSREMRRQVSNPDSVIGSLWDRETMIGFAVAGPAWSRGRASLFNVLIDPGHRGRGLVWPLIARVEAELAVRGFADLDIDARVENGFADATLRRYGSRASVVAADHPSPYGPQRTIRVALAPRGDAPAPKAKRSPHAMTPSHRRQQEGPEAGALRPVQTALLVIDGRGVLSAHPGVLEDLPVETRVRLRPIDEVDAVGVVEEFENADRLEVAPNVGRGISAGGEQSKAARPQGAQGVDDSGHRRDYSFGDPARGLHGERTGVLGHRHADPLAHLAKPQAKQARVRLSWRPSGIATAREDPLGRPRIRRLPGLRIAAEAGREKLTDESLPLRRHHTPLQQDTSGIEEDACGHQVRRGEVKP